MTKRKSNRTITRRKRIPTRAVAPHTKRQSRGGRKPIKRKSSATKRSKKSEDLKFQLGLRFLRTEKSIPDAARQAHLAPEKLRRYAVRKGVLRKRGKRWVVLKDIPRRLLIFSDGKEQAITVNKFRTASMVGKYMAAIRWFVQTNDLDYLAPFVGKSVKDATGNRFLLETRPNILHMLANTGGSSFEQVYRIVV